MFVTLLTVNSEIFTRILFKFAKTSLIAKNSRITLTFADMGIFIYAYLSCNVIRANKILAKISEFTVLSHSKVTRPPDKSA